MIETCICGLTEHSIEMICGTVMMLGICVCFCVLFKA